MNRPKRTRVFTLETLPSRDVPGHVVVGIGVLPVTGAVVGAQLPTKPAGAIAGAKPTAAQTPTPMQIPPRPDRFPYLPNHFTEL